MSDFPEQRGQTLPRLVEVMQTLLGPDGCPWDREQTLESLRQYLIEEAFEAVEAIDKGDADLLREELGDVLLQIVFQAELARKKGWFGPDDVVSGICDKMVRRHPWVFGDADVDSASGALKSWEALKAEERKAEGKSALDGVPVALPGLLRAARVGEKASSVGYDWPDATGPREKIDEELAELDEALAAGDAEAAEEELGDLLLTIASFARKHSMDPEAAVRGAVDKFSRRFRWCEGEARRQGSDVRELTEAELDVLWVAAKATES